MFSSLTRILNYAAKDFVRNIWLSVTTVVMLALTVAVVQAILAVHVLGRATIAALEQRVDLRVQFRSTIGEAEAAAIRARIAQRPEVAAVEQRSRQDVLDGFLADHRSNPDIADAVAEVGENPFGPELRVALRRPEDFPAIAKLLDDPQVRDAIAATDTEDHAALAGSVSALAARLRAVGFAVGAFFLTMTVLIIIQAIRIVTYSRREEAAIMRLVGASAWFVRIPFLMFTVFASAIAVTVVQGATAAVLRTFEPSLVSILGPAALDISVFFRDHVVGIAAAEFLGLSLIVVLAAAVAIRRYLRV